MDFAGVNLQEETASFLPPTVGETTARTCKDELFLDASPLRRKVAPIGEFVNTWWSSTCTCNCIRSRAGVKAEKYKIVCEAGLRLPCKILMAVW